MTSGMSLLALLMVILPRLVVLAIEEPMLAKFLVEDDSTKFPPLPAIRNSSSGQSQ